MKQILMIVDMISPYDFPGADRVAEGASPVVDRITECRRHAENSKLPVVFANDIHGSFSGSREEVFRLALAGRRPELVAPLKPAPHDSFFHKGQHSAFYGTPLAHLLHEWEVDEVVLTGQVTEQCIFYTALDAHVRHYRTRVLRDAVVAQDPALADAALMMMETNLGTTVDETEDWTA